MYRTVRTLVAAAVAIAVLGISSAQCAVTKTRLGTLRKTDYVVTDVTDVGGGTGVVDSAEVARAITNHVESGYLATSSLTNDFRSVADLNVYEYVVSTNGPWTWSTTNEYLRECLDGVKPLYVTNGYWACDSVVTGGWVLASYGMESPTSTTVSIGFSYGYGSAAYTAVATRPLLPRATGDTLATSVSITNINTTVSNMWHTTSSYITYLENYATNNYWGQRTANYRAKRLETWQATVSNDLLLAGATNPLLKASAYFTAANTQLVAAVEGVIGDAVRTNMLASAKSVSDLEGRVLPDDSTKLTNDTEFVTAVTSVVTKSYVEGLNISVGLDTAEVSSLVSATVSNKQDRLEFEEADGETNYLINVSYATDASWADETSYAEQADYADRLESSSGLSRIYSDGAWITRTNATKGVVTTNYLCTVDAASAMTNAVAADIGGRFLPLTGGSMSGDIHLDNYSVFASGYYGLDMNDPVRFEAGIYINGAKGISLGEFPLSVTDNGGLESVLAPDGSPIATSNMVVRMLPSGSMTTNDVSNIVSSTVTKTYVEGLGIEAGTGAATVTNIVASESVTNAGAVASVKAYADSRYVPYVADAYGVKTAVTVGTRPTLSEVSAWSDTATYRQNDIVSREDTIYICTAEPTETVAASAWDSQSNKWQVVSFGRNSFASGSTNVASGVGAHAEGGVAHASGTFAHAEGIFTRASGVAAHAEGTSTHAAGTFTHAEGISTKASGIATHAEGSATVASGSGAHAEGIAASAEGLATHAEGYTTVARGNFTHAAGAYTVAGNAVDTNKTNTSAAYGSAAFAGGYGAVATNQTAFVWQGVATNVEVTATPADSAKYYDHGAGTFSINPVGGLLGLWIGGTNMYDWIVKSSPPVVLPQYWAWGSITNASGEVVTAEKIGAIPSSSLVDTTPADAGEAGKNYAASLRYVQNNAVLSASSNYVKKVEVGGNIIDFTLGNNDTVSYNPSFSMTYPDTMVYKDPAETYITTWGNGSHVTAAMIEGAVPSSRKVNGVALSNDVTVTVVSDTYYELMNDPPAPSAASKNQIYRYNPLDGDLCYQIAEDDGWRVLATTSSVGSAVSAVSSAVPSIVGGIVSTAAYVNVVSSLPTMGYDGRIYSVGTGESARYYISYNEAAQSLWNELALASKVVPTTRKINGQALTGDVTISIPDTSNLMVKSKTHGSDTLSFDWSDDGLYLQAKKNSSPVLLRINMDTGVISAPTNTDWSWLVTGSQSLQTYLDANILPATEYPVGWSVDDPNNKPIIFEDGISLNSASRWNSLKVTDSLSGGDETLPAYIGSTAVTNGGAKAYADSTFRALTNNVCLASSFTDWDFSSLGVQSGVTLSLEQVTDGDDSSWAYYIDGGGVAEHSIERGTKSEMEIATAVHVVQGEDSTPVWFTRKPIASSNDTFVTYGFVTNAVTGAKNEISAELTNTVNSVKSKFYDEQLEVTWEMKMVNGEMKLYATTNANTSVLN